uniref:Uncharacterized protein n=1 Tax=Arcella intermedia TaxID=1963864 RepID=A0A6B2LH98_9EUKA
MALLGSGELFGWGHNKYGELGVGPTLHVLRPSKISIPIDKKERISTLNIPEIVQIGCGSMHSMALLRDGSVYIWGSNLFGQLGMFGKVSSLDCPCKVFAIPERVREIECRELYSVVVTESGKVYCWGNLMTGREETRVFFNGRIDFGEVEGESVFIRKKRELWLVLGWPKTHKWLVMQKKKVIEDFLLILRMNYISKDVIIHLIHNFLIMCM